LVLNVIVCVVFLLMGAGVVIYAATFPDFSIITPIGPDVFPTVMGLAIVVFSIIALVPAVKELVSHKTADGKIDLSEEKEKFNSVIAKIKERKKNFIAMICIPVMMFLYGLLIEIVGFEILSALFLFGSIFLCGERRVLRLILVPTVGTACMYVVFVMVLQIPLHTLFL